MANQKVITPEQRALLFAKYTRPYWQTLPAISTTAGSTISFDLPKSRLINKISLLITDTVTLTHASSTSATPAFGAPFNLINNITVSANTGFKPFSISGVGAYLYNLLSYQAEIIEPEISTTAAGATASRRRSKLGVECAAAGQANPLQMVVDLPLALNDKSPVGLWLAQSNETVITVTISFNSASVLSGDAGLTIASGGITVQPLVHSFSIPKIPEAFPDISIVKLVQEQTATIGGAGTIETKLPTGLTYRKIITYITDATGGESDTDISGDFELVFNQADIPIKISPRHLSAINQEHYGVTLPAGVWVFDFSATQGMANYGGSRDYIDTSKITEFWHRFTAAGAGSIRIISEQISQLRTTN